MPAFDFGCLNRGRNSYMKLRIFIISMLAVVLMISFASTASANMNGIDVSRWQGEIDWSMVSQQVGFAMIKAGGADDGFYTDSQFQRNRDEVRRLGLLRGYYYYAGGGDPNAEAEHFASIVAQLQPGEPVALDFEVDNPDPVGFSLQFMARTEQLLGVKPLLYTYMNKIYSYDWQPVANNGNRLWGAIYDEEALTSPAAGAWPSLTIKQYSSSGALGGISANSVDFNYSSISTEEFRALGLPQLPPPMPAVTSAPELNPNSGAPGALAGNKSGPVPNQTPARVTASYSKDAGKHLEMTPGELENVAAILDGKADQPYQKSSDISPKTGLSSFMHKLVKVN